MGNRDRLLPRARSGPEGKLTAVVEALYWQPPTAAELAGSGLKPKHFKPPRVAIWPENFPAVQLFLDNQTQWRMGPVGPVGLDYNVVFHEIDRKPPPKDEYDDLMGAVRVIESAALREMRRE